MKATVIVDNIGSGAIPGEWGLCIFIEYEDKKVLLDTGASALFANNADKLNLSLCDIDIAVLSHAHYDHANGMRKFFEVNDKAKFYLRGSCAENSYFKKWIFHKYIGIPKGVLSEYQDRIVYASGKYGICEGISLIPHHIPGLYAVGKREKMYQKRNNKWYPDEKVFALIGGFHVFNKPDNEVRALAKMIRDTGIEYVCTGHCTGKRAYGILKEELGDVLHQLKVGLTM